MWCTTYVLIYYKFVEWKSTWLIVHSNYYFFCPSRDQWTSFGASLSSSVCIGLEHHCTVIIIGHCQWQMEEEEDIFLPNSIQKWHSFLPFIQIHKEGYVVVLCIYVKDPGYIWSLTYFFRILWLLIDENDKQNMCSMKLTDFFWVE